MGEKESRASVQASKQSLQLWGLSCMCIASMDFDDLTVALSNVSTWKLLDPDCLVYNINMSVLVGGWPGSLEATYPPPYYDNVCVYILMHVFRCPLVSK